MRKVPRRHLQAAACLVQTLLGLPGLAGPADERRLPRPSEITITPPAAPRPYIEYRSGVRPASPVEVLTDKGPLVEMIIRCGPQSGIISYSKVERLFCGPRGGCSLDFQKVYRATCAAR